MKKILLFEDDDAAGFSPLDIRRDNVFKAVFTRDTPESSGALSKLVSALIGRDVSIISILTNEPPIDSMGDRALKLDINCRAEGGEFINVEMCFHPKPSEPVRLEFYLAKLFSGQEIKGAGKGYKDLKRAYQIAILARERFFMDEEFYHNFEYYDPHNRVSLNGRSRIITLELSKLKKIVEKPAGEMNKSEKWAVYFQYLTDRSKRSIINEIVELEEGIAMASSVLIKVSRDEEERARIMREEKTELDRISFIDNAIEDARAEGYTEGHVKGNAKGRAEEREYFLSLLNQGLTIDEIKQRLKQ